METGPGVDSADALGPTLCDAAEVGVGDTTDGPGLNAEVVAGAVGVTEGSMPTHPEATTNMVRVASHRAIAVRSRMDQ
jgi:hypothetical protein